MLYGLVNCCFLTINCGQLVAINKISDCLCKISCGIKAKTVHKLAVEYKISSFYRGQLDTLSTSLDLKWSELTQIIGLELAANKTER